MKIPFDDLMIIALRKHVVCRFVRWMGYHRSRQKGNNAANQASYISVAHSIIGYCNLSSLWPSFLGYTDVTHNTIGVVVND